MALVESYAPCPCGSGEKYKWCCHKVEAIVEKSLRLQDSGGPDAALAAVEDGLKKHPDSPWLSIRKAILRARQGKTADSVAVLRRLLAKSPGHVGAHNFLVRAIAEVEGTQAAAAQFQRALAAVSPENRSALGVTAQLMGALFGEEGHAPAAIAHLHLADAMDGEDADRLIAQSLRMIEGNPSISPWLRAPYAPAHAPGGLAGPDREAFDRAYGLLADGSWSEAAVQFEALAARGVAGASLNAGLCRLWTADDAAAVSALRAHVAEIGETEEAVDLEALCQIIAPPQHDEPVEHVQLTWPIRNRESLLKALAADPAIHAEGAGPQDPDDPEGPEVDVFALLDRPKPQDTANLSIADAPRLEGTLLVGPDSVALDVYDDGRLNRLSSRFVDRAGKAIPPAHPRTKVIETVPRSSVVLRSEMWLPEDLPRDQADRLTREEHARIIREVWPETRLPYLGRRTPRQVAGDRAYQVALRAAACQLEVGQGAWKLGVDFAALRDGLKIDPEPAIDPAAVDVMATHLARLHRIPAEALDDRQLLVAFVRSHQYALPAAMERAALALVDRPAIFDRGEIDRVVVFADLANLAQGRGEAREGADWLARGRQADKNPRNAARWDFLELKARVRSEAPEQWVPALAVVLERYREDRDSSTTVLSNLVEMGLVQMAPNPDDPGQMLLDTRPLQAVLAQYGPKITTASGRLGVSATQGGIWTPGGNAGGGGGGSGGLWTPGSAASPAGDKPKLIIPGR